MADAPLRILEGVVTTAAPGFDPAGLEADVAHRAGQLRLINVAPMGPMVDDSMSRLILRPFTSSTTYRNLKATGEGVFHVTDDVLLIARGAIGTLTASASVHAAPGIAAIRRADRVHGVVLSGACRYYEFKVVSLDDSSERTRIEVEVMHRGTQREFFGFNRAMHAVIEAAILATRVHLTGPQHVLTEIARLMPAVEKTGGATEHQAIREVREFVERSQMANPVIV